MDNTNEMKNEHKKKSLKEKSFLVFKNSRFLKLRNFTVKKKFQENIQARTFQNVCHV